MRLVLGLLVFSLANAQSEYTTTPIISVEKSYKFVVESVVLLKDLGQYTVTAAVNGLMSAAGPEIAKNIYDTYDDASKRLEMFRLQYNLPSCSGLKDHAKVKFDILISFLAVLNNKVNDVSKPLQLHLTAFLNRFTASVPGSASFAPGLLDRLLTFFYLYFVLRTVLKIALFFLCLPCKLCKLCGGNKKPQNEPKRAGRYSKDKKKN